MSCRKHYVQSCARRGGLQSGNTNIVVALETRSQPCPFHQRGLFSSVHSVANDVMSFMQAPSQQRGLEAILQASAITSNLAPYENLSYPAVSQLPGVLADSHDGSLISRWYISDPQQRWSDPAKNAYDNAIAILRKELTDEEYQQLRLQSQHSVSDVQSAVESARQEYQAKSKGSKIQSALTTCSSRIMFYGGAYTNVCCAVEAIFDTFSQHHPEYVSLGWGALKFLFVAVLNHEELLVEISKAVSRIALVLPRTELHSVLYPTPRMQDAVSQLYAKIIEFALMAIKWYKKGKLSHSFTAIIKPFSLGFKPIVEEIAERSKHVDELASAAVKAEIRDLHVNIHRQNKTILQLTEMVSFMQQQQSLQTQSLLALKEEHKQMFRASQLEDIRTVALLEDTAVADDSLAWCRSMRNRRRQKAPTQLPLSELYKLKAWTSDLSSSLLLAEGQGVKTSSLDFAADFLDIVLEQGYPVIWALSSIVIEHDNDSLLPSVSGIIRSLISQALALNDTVVSEGINPLTPKHFKSAVSIAQWLDILDRCVSSFKRLFIVLDMNAIESAFEEAEAEEQYFKLGDFMEWIRRKSQSRGAIIKIIVVSWRFGVNTPIDAETFSEDTHMLTDRGRKIERLMKQTRFRAAFGRKHQNFRDKLRSSIALDDTKYRL